ncbi:hypothetical protein Vretimale_3325 [Volvox reticuliferus]|uniref:Uncharacterized protein n=1 Tax=Volvox reticuliferus TaxID=1737510 RepID=A0A8J4D8M0_9CHLO|nr:hypothetical protein Vretimale_3325 [Volvox reticuliferus]
MASARDQALGEWQSLYNEFLSAERAAENAQQTLAPDPKWPVPLTELSMTDLTMPASRKYPNGSIQPPLWAPLPGELFEAVAEDCWTEDAVAVEEELLRRLKAQSPSPKSRGGQLLGHAPLKEPPPANNVPPGHRSPGPHRPHRAMNFSTPQHNLSHPSAMQRGFQSPNRLRSTMPGGNGAAGHLLREAWPAQRNAAIRASMPAAFAQPKPPSSQESVPGITGSSALQFTSQSDAYAHQQRPPAMASAVRSFTPATEANMGPYLDQQPASRLLAAPDQSPQPSHSTHVAYPQRCSPVYQGLRLRSNSGRMSMPSPTRSTPRDTSPRSGSCSRGSRQQSGSYVALHHKRQNSPPRPYPPEPRDELFEALHRGVSPNRLRLLIKAVGTAAYEKALRVSREARVSSPSRIHACGVSSVESRQERQPAPSAAAISRQRSRQLPTPQQQQQQQQEKRNWSEHSSYSSVTNSQVRPHREAGAAAVASQPFLSSDKWPRRWGEEDQPTFRRQRDEVTRAVRRSPIGHGALRASAPSAAPTPAPHGAGRETISAGGRLVDSPLVGGEKRRANRPAGVNGKRSPQRTATASSTGAPAATLIAAVEDGEGTTEPRRDGGVGGRPQGVAARQASAQVLHASASALHSPELFISPQAYREYAARGPRHGQQQSGSAASEEPKPNQLEDDEFSTFNVRNIQQRLNESMNAAGRRSVVLPTPPIGALFTDAPGDGDRAPPYDLPLDAHALREARRRAVGPVLPVPAMRHPSPSAPGAPDVLWRTGDIPSPHPSFNSRQGSLLRLNSRQGSAGEMDPPKFELLEDTDMEFEYYEGVVGSRGGAAAASAGPPPSLTQMEWHANPAYGMSLASSSGGGSAAVRSSWPATAGRGEPASELSLASMLPGRQASGIVPPGASTGTSVGASSSLSESLRRSVESRAGAYAWPDDAALPSVNSNSELPQGILQREDPCDASAASLPPVLDLQVAARPPAAGGGPGTRGAGIDRSVRSVDGDGGAGARALTAAAAAVVASAINSASARAAPPKPGEQRSQLDGARAVAPPLDVASITEQLSHMDLASLELIRGYASGYIDGRVQSLPHQGQIRSQVVKSAILRLVDDVLQAKRDATILQAPPPSADSAAAVPVTPPETTAIVAAAAMATAAAPAPAAPIGGISTAAAAAPVPRVTHVTVDDDDVPVVASAAGPSGTRICSGRKTSMALFHKELVARIQQDLTAGAASSSASASGSRDKSLAVTQPAMRNSDSGTAATVAAAAAVSATIGSNQSPGRLSSESNRRHLKRVSWQSDMGSLEGDYNDGVDAEDSVATLPSDLSRPRAHTPQRMRLPSAPPGSLAAAVGPLLDGENGAAAAAVVVTPLKPEVCLELELNSNGEEVAPDPTLASIIESVAVATPRRPSASSWGSAPADTASSSKAMPSAMQVTVPVDPGESPKRTPLPPTSTPAGGPTGPLSALLFELSTTGTAATVPMAGESVASVPTPTVVTATRDVQQQVPAYNDTLVNGGRQFLAANCSDENSSGGREVSSPPRPIRGRRMSSGSSSEDGVSEVPVDVFKHAPVRQILMDGGCQTRNVNRSSGSGGSGREASPVRHIRGRRTDGNSSGGGGLAASAGSSSRCLSSSGQRLGQHSSSLAQLIAAHLSDESMDAGSVRMANDPTARQVVQPRHAPLRPELQPQPQSPTDTQQPHAQPECQPKTKKKQPPSQQVPPAEAPAQLASQGHLTPEQIQIQLLRQEIEELKRQAFWSQQQQLQQQQGLASQAGTGGIPNAAMRGASDGESAASCFTGGSSVLASSNCAATATGAAASTTSSSAASAGHSADVTRSETRTAHRTRGREGEQLGEEAEVGAKAATAGGAKACLERRLPATGSPRSCGGAAAPSGTAPSPPRVPGSVRRAVSVARVWPHAGGAYPGLSARAAAGAGGSTVPIAAFTSPPRAHTAMGIMLSKPAYAGVLNSPPLSPGSSRPAKLQAMSTSPPANVKTGDGHPAKDRSPPSSGRSRSPGRRGVPPPPPLRGMPDLDQALRTESMWFIQQLEAAMSVTNPGSNDVSAAADDGLDTQAATGTAGIQSDAGDMSGGKISVGVGGSPRGDQLLRDLVARGSPRAGQLLQELREASLDELAAAVVGLLGGGSAVGPSDAMQAGVLVELLHEAPQSSRPHPKPESSTPTGRPQDGDVLNNGRDNSPSQAPGDGNELGHNPSPPDAAQAPACIAEPDSTGVDAAAPASVPHILIASAATSLKAPPSSADAVDAAANHGASHQKTSVFATDAAAVAAAVATVMVGGYEDAAPSQQHSNTEIEVPTTTMSHAGITGDATGSMAGQLVASAAVSNATASGGNDKGTSVGPSIGLSPVSLLGQPGITLQDQSLKDSMQSMPTDISPSAPVRLQNLPQEVIPAVLGHGDTVQGAAPLFLSSSHPESSRRDSNSGSNNCSSSINSNNSCGGTSHRRLLDPQGSNGAPPRGVAMAYLRRQPGSGPAATLSPLSPPSGMGLVAGGVGSDAEASAHDPNSAFGSHSTSASQSSLPATAGGNAAASTAATADSAVAALTRSTGPSSLSTGLSSVTSARESAPDGATVSVDGLLTGGDRTGDLSSPSHSHLDSTVAVGSAAADDSNAMTELGTGAIGSVHDVAVRTSSRLRLELTSSRSLSAAEIGTEPQAAIAAEAATPTDTPADSGANTPTRSKPRESKSIEPVLNELRAVRASMATEGDPDGSRATRMKVLLDQLDSYRRGVERRHGHSHSIVTQLRILHGDMSKWLHASTARSNGSGGIATSPKKPQALAPTVEAPPPLPPSEITKGGTSLEKEHPVESVGVAAALHQHQQQEKSLPTIGRESQSSVNTDATFDLVGASAGATPRDSGTTPRAENFAFPPQQQLAPPQLKAGPGNATPSLPTLAGNPPAVDADFSNKAPNAPGKATGAPGASPDFSFLSSAPSLSMHGGDGGSAASAAATVELRGTASFNAATPSSAAEGAGGTAQGGMSLLDLANQLNSMTMQQKQGLSTPASAASGSSSAGATAGFLPGLRASVGAQAATAEAAPSRTAVGMDFTSAQSVPTPQRQSRGSELKAMSSEEAVSKKDSKKQKTKSKWGLLFGGKK